jgi:FlaA1/EpsC-like NDP-sugar epimerase
LVTGCCGTVGQELTRQLLDSQEIEEVVGLDNNETELFFLEQKYSGFPAHFFLADIRDKEKLTRLMRGVDVVFHTAAFKHVVLCERSPFEAVQTNIFGVQNMITGAREEKVKKVIFTSSDKAVNPTNVMGTSKLMGERLMTAANSNRLGKGPIFTSTRFGNVLGSRGSVIPIFREQIKKGGPVTLTDPEMTRFIMSLKQAVEMVIDSARLAKGGEVFVTKMPVIRIKDLADVMISDLAAKYGFDPGRIRVETIGSKAGEKLYEELMNSEETRRTVELPNYYVITPAFKSLYGNVDYTYSDTLTSSVTKPYNSANTEPLSLDELRAFLHKNEILEGEDKNCFYPDERY